MRSEEFLIDPRLVMIAVEVRNRDQFDKIAITGRVLCQQRKMIRCVALRIRSIFDRTRRHVGLAADDRSDACRRGLLIKFNRSVEVAMVSNRDRGHAEFHRFSHQLFHPHRPIKQRIFSVQMEMNEGVRRHRNSL